MPAPDPTRVEIGYWLSSEEHAPRMLVQNARRAEEAGFSSAMISDHYHPWTDHQGESPFVWSVLGAIAQATKQLRVGTGVTAPIKRMHPAIVAQAAATTATLMPGRFFLGLGSGERLNEHIVGSDWPPAHVRLAMLEEAVEIIRMLWRGETYSRRGGYFTVDNARLYSLPDEPPPIFVAAGSPQSAEAAGRFGDGLVGVTPTGRLVEAFEIGGGIGKPRLAQAHVCWAETEAEARRVAHRWWPVAAMQGAVLSDLALPRDIERVARLVREQDVARVVVCGSERERHLAAIARFAASGFNRVYIHQIGPDQEGFFRFYEREVLPRFAPPGSEEVPRTRTKSRTGAPSAARAAKDG
jgi:G6PDH family F420-dependent oxidoreductase